MAFGVGLRGLMETAQVRVQEIGLKSPLKSH